MTNLLTIGALNLGATFNSIAVEAVYTDDDNENATCVLEYKVATSATWLPCAIYRYMHYNLGKGTAGTLRAFYGKIHWLAAGTAYNVRVTFADADGLTGAASATGTVTTRAENILTPAQLAATANRFISPTGLDTNDGLTPATPWRTLSKASLHARTAFDIICRAAPGRYTHNPGTAASWNFSSTTVHNTALVAQNPACVEQTVMIGGRERIDVVEANAGQRSIIEPRASVDHGPAVFAPAGTTGPDVADLQVGYQWLEATSTTVNATRTISVPRIGPWTQVQVRGFDGVDRPVWKAVGCALATAGFNACGFSNNGRDGDYTRLGNWEGSGSFSVAGLMSPGTWAQALAQSPHLNSGCLVMKTIGTAFIENGVGVVTNGLDIYVVMPADSPSLDPNTYWWKVNVTTAAGQNKLRVGGVLGSTNRVCGFELSVGSIFLQSESATLTNDNTIVDHNLIKVCGGSGITFWSYPVSYPGAFTYVMRSVVQYNRIVDNRLTAPADMGGNTAMNKLILPWGWVKSGLRHGAAGIQSIKNGDNEVVAISGSSGWPQWSVIRFNHVEGSFDGCSDYYPDDRYDRWSGYGSDLHDNYFLRLGDDVTDLSRHKVNVSIFSNRIEKCATIFSQAPCWSGPTYYIHNEIWDIGDGWRGAGGDKASGTVDPSGFGGTPVAYLWKYGDQGASQPEGLVIYEHNTCWTNRDALHGSNEAMFGFIPGGSNGNNLPYFRVRNSITRMGSTLIIYQSARTPTMAGWVEDYNDWSATDTYFAGPKFLYRTLGQDTDSWTVYQTASGQGVHSNIRGANPLVESELMNAAAGDIRLRGGSVLATAGIVSPGVSLPGLLVVSMGAGSAAPGQTPGAIPSVPVSRLRPMTFGARVFG